MQTKELRQAVMTSVEARKVEVLELKAKAEELVTNICKVEAWYQAIRAKILQ